jgi:hypothetical protein
MMKQMLCEPGKVSKDSFRHFFSYESSFYESSDTLFDLPRQFLGI